MEKVAMQGGLKGVELFLYTDISTAEAAYYNGSLGNKRLDALVVRLKKVEANEQMHVHFLHIASTQMIELGIDRLLRGSLMEGVMRDPSLLGSVPFHLSAFKRTDDDGKLLSWFHGWMGVPHIFCPLMPDQWLVEGQGLTLEGDDSGKVWMPVESLQWTFLWAPPLVVVDVALEELQKAQHKQPQLFHVFVCPRLMTPRWHRALCKEADFQFEIPVGSSLWPTSSHEPLFVGIFLPFIHHRPWQLKQSPKLLGMERKLQGMWKSGEGDPKDILCKLRLLPGKLDAMSESMVQRVLQGTSLR